MSVPIGVARLLQTRGACAPFNDMTAIRMGRSAQPQETPVVVCPARFEQAQLPIRWLAEIVGFVAGEAMLAREGRIHAGNANE